MPFLDFDSLIAKAIGKVSYSGLAISGRAIVKAGTVATGGVSGQSKLRNHQGAAAGLFDRKIHLAGVVFKMRRAAAFARQIFRLFAAVVLKTPIK